MEAWGFNIFHAIWFLKPSLECSFVEYGVFYGKYMLSEFELKRITFAV